jgi:nucleoside-diphosphate-sugar epimerase
MLVGITGATGFIGGALMNKCLSRDYNVRILTRQYSSSRLIPSSVEVVNADLTEDSDGIDEFVKGLDVLFHCAGELNDKSKMHEVHVKGTSRLLAAAQGKIGHWVQLSSVGAYGPPQGPANINRVVTENSAPWPQGVYETTKTQSDELVMQACEHGSFSYSIVRPSNVFGADMPNQSLRSLGAMMARQLFFYVGRPGALATYVHVDDVVEVLLRCGIDPRAKGEVFNISNDCLLEDMVNGMASALGVARPWLRLPEPFVRLVTSVAENVVRFPLTQERIDTLVSRTKYPNVKLEQKLDFTPQVNVPSAIGEVL